MESDKPECSQGDLQETNEPHDNPAALNSKVPSLSFDRNGRVLDVTETWLQFCGFTRTEVLGNTMKIVQGPETEQSKLELLKEACAKRIPIKVALTNYNKRGEAFENQVELKPMPNDEFITVNRISSASGSSTSEQLECQEKPTGKSSLEALGLTLPRRIRACIPHKKKRKHGTLAITPLVNIPSVQSIHFLDRDSWHLSYVRTRNKNLRCFPFCSPLHKERSFCGVPIRLHVSCSNKEVAGQNKLIGAFRGVDEDFLVKPGDPYKPEWDEPRESDSHLVGHFVLHDKVEQVSKYEFAAPRKWSYKCSKSKYTSMEQHTFTVYLFAPQILTHHTLCVAFKDSPSFRILSAWKQSSQTVPRPDRQIDVRAESTDGNTDDGSDGGKTVA